MRKQRKTKRKTKRKPKPKAPDHRVVWHSPLPIRVHYAFIPNEKAWHAALKTLKVSPRPYTSTEGACMWIERAVATEALPYKNVILVTIKDYYDTHPDKAGTAALIAHEANHVWQYMCKAVGEDAPSDELESLFLEQVIYTLLNDFCRTRKNIFR